MLMLLDCLPAAPDPGASPLPHHERIACLPVQAIEGSGRGAAVRHSMKIEIGPGHTSVQHACKPAFPFRARSTR